MRGFVKLCSVGTEMWLRNSGGTAPGICSPFTGQNADDHAEPTHNKPNKIYVSDVNDRILFRDNVCDFLC